MPAESPHTRKVRENVTKLDGGQGDSGEVRRTGERAEAQTFSSVPDAVQHDIRGPVQEETSIKGVARTKGGEGERAKKEGRSGKPGATGPLALLRGANGAYRFFVHGDGSFTEGIEEWKPEISNQKFKRAATNMTIAGVPIGTIAGLCRYALDQYIPWPAEFDLLVWGTLVVVVGSMLEKYTNLNRQRAKNATN